MGRTGVFRDEVMSKHCLRSHGLRGKILWECITVEAGLVYEDDDDNNNMADPDSDFN